MKKLFKNFIICGITGWCLEIMFTALHSLRRRDMKLTGQSSLWMFPIYGSAAFLEPLCSRIKGKPALLRGGFYAIFIFIGEFITGSLLSGKNLCPWDYSRSKWHINKVIRLDYIPNWILAGLLFERILTHDSSDNIS